jgi:precorrin-8X/cobalt-precorrin-8 methylmutase
MIAYLRDPEEIYQKSFATIRAEADLSQLPEVAHGIAVRMIHASGMTDLPDLLRVDPRLPHAVREALARTGTVLVDSEMVQAGIIRRTLPRGVETVCTLNTPEARDIGLARRTTRSAAAVSLWAPHLSGSVVVIGNAPTALFALLELIDGGASPPAAIIAMPVGFVGAVEAKEELAANPRGIPYVTLLGRRGGSAMASAAFNACTVEER